ncbi:MAG: efflux RND transporter periplasmic adaptor subunit [Actinomycetaceae bacterium]|nr:efflux RND transporter periplasmic adaptor subunit [Actinomycetaceae bacterium]
MDAHPTRTFIMQILKLIVWTIVAIALVKFAFFPSQPPKTELTGDGEFTLPTVTVARGDISHEITLDASVVRDESETVKATASGTIVWFYVEDGAKVDAGDYILQIEHVEMPEIIDPEAPPAEPIKTYHNVVAETPGTLSLDALMEQEVQIGTPVGTIVPDTFHAQVPVTPDQLYSLQGIPEEAELSVTGGPAPFTCTGLKTMTGAPTGKEGEQNTGPQLRCEIPSSELVFDGVKAKLIIRGGNATNALVVPVTAVEGRYKTGNVYLPVDDITQKPEKVEVKLGVSDGYSIEITEGLTEGQEILEFVPRQDPEEQNPDDMSFVG